MSVTLKVGGDNREAIRVVEQLQKKVEQLEASNKRLSLESKKGAQESSMGWEKAAAGIGQAVAGYVSLQTAISNVTNALREKMELEKEAANVQARVSGSQRSFLINMGLANPAEKQAANERILAIARSTGASLDSLYAAAGTAASARGGLSFGQTWDALGQAARVQPGNAGELNALTGGLLDMSKLSGSGDAKVNLGLTVGVAQMARLTNLQQVSQNLIPAAINVAQRGGSAQQALAQVATITGALADATGATSGTAGIQLSNQLAEMLPETDVYETITRNGREIRRLKTKGTGLNNSFDRIRFAQDNPLFREKFLAQASFEQKAGAAVEQLLTKDSELSRLLFANEAAMPSFADAPGIVEGFIEGIDQSALQVSGNRRRIYEGASERESARDARAAAIAETWDGLSKNLAKVGVDPLARTAMWGEYRYQMMRGVDPDEYAIQLLERRADITAQEGAYTPANPRYQVDDDAKQQAAYLREIAEGIRQLVRSRRPSDPDRHIEK